MPNPEKLRVAVLVLNHNGLSWLKICLPSLIGSLAPGRGIFVVDNGSTDGSAEHVLSHFPQFRVLRFDKNLGFAKAYNQAIEQVPADYVVLLNNDTAILSNNWIDNMLELIERDSDLGAVQCKLVSFADHDMLDSIGVMGVKYWQGFADIGKSEADKGQYDSRPMSPFSICGAGALIRRSAFLEVGGFDSQFFAYLEDVDLSWRLRLGGYRIVYQPLARIAHAWHGYFRLKPDAFQTYLSRKNLLRMLLKNCGRRTFWWALRNYLIFSCLMCSAYLVMGDKKAISVLKALVWNIVHFKETYSQRLEVQVSRKVSETSILRDMFPDFAYHPLRHEKLRRTLNTVLGREWNISA